MHPVIRSLTGSPDSPELTFRRIYRASPADLFDACTRPERLARWLGVVEGNPRAGGDRFTIRLSEEPDDVAEARILSCDDGEFRIAWTWTGEPESTIAVRVSPVGDDSSELTLHHALNRDDAVDYGTGWERLLTTLSRSLGAETGAEEEDAADDAWRTITRAPLHLERRVAVPVERVWQAFATPEGLKRWWWNQWSDVEIETDARVGGGYRIAAPGAGITLEGTYLVVNEPERLAFSWVWRDADGESRDEAVDIRFHADGEETRIVIRHTGPWADDAPAVSYRQGWGFTLAQFDSAAC